MSLPGPRIEKVQRKLDLSRDSTGSSLNSTPTDPSSGKN